MNAKAGCDLPKNRQQVFNANKAMKIRQRARSTAEALATKLYLQKWIHAPFRNHQFGPPDNCSDLGDCEKLSSESALSVTDWRVTDY